MNKKDLLKILEQVDDDTEIITTSNNYELRGSKVKARAYIGKYKVVKENFRDDFDGTRYSSDVYIQDEDGKSVVIISG